MDAGLQIPISQGKRTGELLPKKLLVSSGNVPFDRSILLPWAGKPLPDPRAYPHCRRGLGRGPMSFTPPKGARHEKISVHNGCDHCYVSESYASRCHIIRGRRIQEEKEACDLCRAFGMAGAVWAVCAGLQISGISRSSAPRAMSTGPMGELRPGRSKTFPDRGGLCDHLQRFKTGRYRPVKFRW